MLNDNETIYRTLSGDAWDLIAYRIWQTERYTPDLIDANPAHRWTAIFNAGVELTVPNIEIPIPESLPSWRAV